MIKFLLQLPFLFTLAGQATETIDLYFTPKEPYYYSDSTGQHRGFLLEPIKQKLEAQNFKIKTQEVPPKRILTELLLNNKNLCSIGWFKTPERSKLYLFSNRIYKDQTLVFVSVKNVKENLFENFLSNNQIKIGLVIGYSYSAIIDPIIEKHIGFFTRDVQNTEDAMRMLANGRIGGTLMSQEEFDHFSRKIEFKNLIFYTKKFKEFPVGSSRYIICTKATSPSIIGKINFAIK